MPIHSRIASHCERVRTFFLPLALLVGTVSISAEPNRVLELKGDGGYVELPSGAFENLEAATIEGWIKWEEFSSFSRFFDFGEEWRAINITHNGTSQDLSFPII